MGSASKKAAQPVVVKTFDEWFSAVDAIVADIERYEALARTYYQRRDESQNWGRPHKRAFWRDEKPFTTHDALHFVKAGFLGLILGPAVELAYAFRVTREIDIARIAIAALIGIVSMCAIVCAVKLIRRAMLTHRMAKIEQKLEPTMTLVDAKYRNSMCCSNFVRAHEVFFVPDYESARRAVDNHLQKLGRAYQPFAMMSDVPFDGRGLAAAARTGRTRSKADPNLPVDIESHTHAGPSDWKTEMDNLVGLDSVKVQVSKMQARMRVYGGASVIGGNNMALLGPAGTGKTSIARVLTGMLAEAGYIDENRIVEVDGDYLKSPKVGATGERVNAVCRWAAGGVLFIDEAYLLLDPNSNVGAEATGVLLKEMEDNAQNLVVMLAGYTDQMERLISSNDGFRSRIRHTLRFDPYSAGELTEICRRMLAARGIKIAEDAAMAISAEFARELKSPGFGGAREARNCADALIDARANAIARSGAGDAHLIGKTEAVSWVAIRMREMADVRHDFLSTMGIDESIVSSHELESRTHDVTESAEHLLAGIVGQDSAKQELAAWSARIKMTGASGTSSHVALLGPAGVGKTTFAEAVVAAMHECGLIERARVVDITGDWLRAAYVGQTGKRTEAAIQWSRGGVLFIDEAYLLADAGQAGFGAEALGVLVNDMEKYDDLTVILAGYEGAMGELFAMNEGLSSRIATKLHLAPYTVRELMLILQRMARARKFKLAPDIYRALQPGVKRAMRETDFGQGRAMRVLLDALIDAHALRWDADRSIDPNVLEVADAEAAISKLGW